MPDDPAEEGEEHERDEDPVDAIFRIIEQYYEGVKKREDEGIGAE
ncbi:MAG: hypothetical protein SV186_06825 [Candidatus Nanohaloarchaea archaeon]|nr:hypothetical protein [Candidatus Nanohaloarchaea archaeon]